MSWDEFVRALREADAYWQEQSPLQFNGRIFSVLGENWSWKATIARGEEIARREDWENLTRDEQRVLLGIWTREATGAWDLLGNMGAAATARGAFYDNDQVRMTIREALNPVIDASGEEQFLQAAEQTIESIDQLRGFGPAIATRLIALARPDRGISLNRGSVPELTRLTGIRATKRNYLQLLRWLYRQPWYRTSKPHDPWEQTIWSMRAALIDCLVYKRV
jgi:hypothetical protein